MRNPLTKEKKAMKTDGYKEVTAAIVADLEKGVRPWLKPWSIGTLAGQVCRPRRWNGQAYSGINILSLWSASCAKGYVSPTWMTFRQAQELGGQVRKGERAARVVHAGETRKTETADDGSETEREIRFLKAYAVFNVEQIDGLPERYHLPPEPRPDAPQRIAHADAFFAATGAEIRHGGASAHFDLQADSVQMPPLEAF
tara:strand:- start:43 stop:639 length:597 start_codon:yes stop_codon:yes gene_type:complete